MKNDLISRREAIRWVKTECNPYGKPTLDYESGKKVIEHLEAMPSAQPDHIGDVNGMVSFTEKERLMLKKMRTLHNGTYADLLDRLVASAQEDADSAYIEGYTAAESKYRKMWDEMQANIKEKAFGKRKGLIHTADICPIDRNALLKRYDATHVGPPGKARDLILNAPTIEPERKTGKWIIKETAFEDTEAKCSNCGFVTLVNDPGNGLHMVSDLLFCPRCGSFNGGEEHETSGYIQGS